MQKSGFLITWLKCNERCESLFKHVFLTERCIGIVVFYTNTDDSSFS